MRALFRALGNILRLLLAPLWLGGRWLARPKAPWVVLRVRPRVTQFRPAAAALLRRLLERARAVELRTTSIEELRLLVDHIVADDRVHGLLVYLPVLEVGWATCQSLRDTLSRLRLAGKQVVCYLPEGGGNRELYVALVADRIFVAPFTAFGPLGMAARPLYIRSLLDRVGVSVEAQSCGEYKSAAEPALRDNMSEPAREQLEAMLWAMHNALSAALRERRGVSEARLQELFERGILTAADAISAGIVDGTAYEDELADRVAGISAPPETTERESAHNFVASGRYVRLRSGQLWKPVRRRSHIAVVPLRGTIAGDQGGSLGTALRHAQVAATLRALAANDKVAAIVLYVDSPGGSALASELIHREVQRLARKKPVVACFGDVAASGGYYIACACRSIVAQPLTVTGSIGVVSAKLEAAALLDRLGIRPQLVRTAQSADMMSFVRALSPNEKRVLESLAAELYARFLDVVAEGRKRPVAEIEPLARGRVWIGTDAHERRLVDVLGGLDRAVDEARALLEGLSLSARAALKTEVYRPKSGAAAVTATALPESGLAWLAARLGVLPELDLLWAARHELAVYYAREVPPHG